MSGNPALIEQFIKNRKLQGKRRYEDLRRAKDARRTKQVERHWHDVAEGIIVSGIQKRWQRHG